MCDPQPIQNHKLLPALLRPASPAATSRQQHTSPPTEAACGGQLIPVFPSNLPCGAKNPRPVPCSLTSWSATRISTPYKLTLCDVVQSFQSRQFEDPSVRDGLVPDQRRGTSARGLGQRKQSRRVHCHRHCLTTKCFSSSPIREWPCFFRGRGAGREPNKNKPQTKTKLALALADNPTRSLTSPLPPSVSEVALSFVCCPCF